MATARPQQDPVRFHILDVLYNDHERFNTGFIELYGITDRGHSIKVDVDFQLYFYLDIPEDALGSAGGKLGDDEALREANKFIDDKVWCARKGFIAKRELVRLEPARPYTFHSKRRLLKLTFNKEKHLLYTRAALFK